MWLAQKYLKNYVSFTSEDCRNKLWKQISKKFEDLGGLNQPVRSMQWKILGNAAVNEFEVSERMSITIPQNLREYAQLSLKNQITLVGMGSKFELWNLDNWEKKLSGMQIAGENLIENLPPSLEEIEVVARPTLEL